jgi:hypothetical protein
MTDRKNDHVATGWTDDGQLRWIEVGRMRLVEEDKDGATLLVLNADVVRQGGCDVQLSSAELAGLVRHLAGWFAEDPSESLDEIEAVAKRVRAELEVWNDRARIDEEHPPYDDLTRMLDGLVRRCHGLREDLGKFVAKETKVVIVKASNKERSRGM